MGVNGICESRSGHTPEPSAAAGRRDDARASIDEFQPTVPALPDLVWSAAVPSGEMLYLNPAFREVFGRGRQQTLGDRLHWADLVLAQDHEILIAAWNKALECGNFEAEFRILTDAGETRRVQSRGCKVFDDVGNAVRIDGISRDVTESHAQSEKLASLSRISAISGRIANAGTQIDKRQELLREACRVAVLEGGFGTAWIGVVDGKKLSGLAHFGCASGNPRDFELAEPGSSESQHGTACRAIAERRAVFVNDIDAEVPQDWTRQMTPSPGYGSVISLPLQIDHETEGVISLYARRKNFCDTDVLALLNQFARSISLGLAHIHQRNHLRHLTLFDPVTGLSNPAMFQQRLVRMLEEARASRSQTMVALLDIERFRFIRTTIGPRAADMLLREVASRLRSSWPVPENVARLSADTFALALTPGPSPGQVAAATAALETCIDAVLMTPFKVHGRQIGVFVSAGVAVAPADGTDVDRLLRKAETAQRVARRNGERVVLYRNGMSSRLASALGLEGRLRRAFLSEQFELHYQPKRTAVGGAIAGVEGLIRWREPKRGLIAPRQFVSVLEETGLILPVGDWIMSRALSDARLWRTPEGRHVRVAVNVSALQLRQRKFLDSVRRAMESVPEMYGLLDLEITESTIMQDLEDTVSKLRAVREMGVNVAVDDFGTGYSSLRYLAQLPVNALKIDRSFIATMMSNAHSMTLVSTIISLAHSFELKVIAEGVESEEQAKTLRLLKCDELQGYLISRPLPAGEVQEKLSSWGAAAASGGRPLQA